MADQQWALAGARSAREMRGFMVSRVRRRIGMAVVQAMARHRIARLPFIGVPRPAVVEHMRRRAMGRDGEVAAELPGHAHWEFFQFQAGPAAAGIAAA